MAAATGPPRWPPVSAATMLGIVRRCFFSTRLSVHVLCVCTAPPATTTPRSSAARSSSLNAQCDCKVPYASLFHCACPLPWHGGPRVAP